jgi:hypothetical protein
VYYAIEASVKQKPKETLGKLKLKSIAIEMRNN